MTFIQAESDDEYQERLRNPENLRAILDKNGGGEEPADICWLCEKQGTPRCPVFKEPINGHGISIEGPYCHVGGHCVDSFKLIDAPLSRIEEMIFNRLVGEDLV